MKKKKNIWERKQSYFSLSGPPPPLPHPLRFSVSHSLLPLIFLLHFLTFLFFVVPPPSFSLNLSSSSSTFCLLRIISFTYPCTICFSQTVKRQVWNPHMCVCICVYIHVCANTSAHEKGGRIYCTYTIYDMGLSMFLRPNA